MGSIAASRAEALDSSTSLKFVIRNVSRKTIRRATLAWLDYDRHPLWGDPIPFDEAIAPGRTAVIDVTEKKIRIVEYKIKFFIDGVRYLLETGHPPEEPGPWFFWTEVELTHDQHGFFLSKQSWSRVAFAAD